MRAGNLDRRIRFERATEAQDPDSGAPILTWDPPAASYDCAAEVRPLRGQEYFAAQQFAAKADTLFRIRWPRGFETLPEPDESVRLMYDGRIYNIQHVAEIGRREGLEILATARAEAA
ncbi:MAG: hypothetical protein A2V88_15960 [Elusimicrobia bacterium RBG_16_66_12]|nr:MAG: hypothetical protein A2V88_15960 [Elusimicrobia bacterium RBG_16_66_12]